MEDETERNTEHHRIKRSELVNGIMSSYGYLVEVARHISKVRQNADSDDPIVDRKAVRRAMDKFDAEERWPNELQEMLEDQGSEAIAITGKNMTHAAVEGDMAAMKFVLDRKGRDEGWGKEETITHKGESLIINISKDEAQI